MVCLGVDAWTVARVWVTVRVAVGDVEQPHDVVADRRVGQACHHRSPWIGVSFVSPGTLGLSSLEAVLALTAAAICRFVEAR